MKKFAVFLLLGTLCFGLVACKKEKISFKDHEISPKAQEALMEQYELNKDVKEFWTGEMVEVDKMEGFYFSIPDSWSVNNDVSIEKGKEIVFDKNALTINSLDTNGVIVKSENDNSLIDNEKSREASKKKMLSKMGGLSCVTEDMFYQEDALVQKIAYEQENFGMKSYGEIYRIIKLDHQYMFYITSDIANKELCQKQMDKIIPTIRFEK